jgi:hypothetical protein
LEASIALSDFNDGKMPTLFKVPEKLLTQDDSDEVWYDNDLYDVVKRETLHDSEFVYLLRDEDEQDILMANTCFFMNDSGGFSGNAYHLCAPKKINPITDESYIPGIIKRMSRFHPFFLPLIGKKQFYHSSVFADVPEPPPKKCMIL